ncbi:MAG: DAK2 domain-containing protein [Dehalococcoidales bacterium]
MKQVDTIGGQDLKEMFSAATNWLEKSAPDIDALNVFPVPDGDCGTNMLLTMRSSIEEAGRAPSQSICIVAQSMAKGALMGARGNSGVILSQIWRGVSKSFDGKDAASGADLAEALTEASDTAYKGLSNPVEGTILTVLKDAAKAARDKAAGKTDVIDVLESATDAASESVANTPSLLPILRETGVVDAGGQGLFTLLEGALLYLRGDVQLMQFRKSRVIASSIPITAKPIQVSEEEEVSFGYCTEFLLKGEDLNPDRLRKKLKSKGESLIVVGDDSTLRVHIHTTDPGNVLHYVTSLGTLGTVSIRNMDEQHEDFLVMQKNRMPSVDMAIVAVVPGEGLADVFTSLGTTAIVPGGQSMNPSTKDILQAVEAAPSDKVIILPNNKNVILSAQQVEAVTSKHIKVVPTETIPQGAAALLAFDYEADFDTNARLMAEATTAVTTIEITRATRSAKINGLVIKKKQAIGLIDGHILGVENKPNDVLNVLMARVNLDKKEVVTIYFGADTQEEEAGQVAGAIRESYANLQVEVVNGGQPYYNYIVSAE